MIAVLTYNKIKLNFYKGSKKQQKTLYIYTCVLEKYALSSHGPSNTESEGSSRKDKVTKPKLAIKAP